ncbi:MAG: HisS family protein [Clostridia bacterium]|nr:HisS family protein [Clostridia bacterium]
MKITPVKGTSDYLPLETELRDYLQSEILNVYKSNGFMHISTPILEDIENLNKSEGGDNLNLIFKIMKRGEKLEKALVNKEFGNLADIGLRYDLTLPLTRYYANNREKLPNPFKCIQIDRAFRAENTQKGRMREFVQCDIDIIGSSNVNSEIELIKTTTDALLKIGLDNFKVRINNRKVLKKFIENLGFKSEELDSVCITFDKLDKIGTNGIKEELIAKNLDAKAIDKLVYSLEKTLSLEDIEKTCGKMEEIDQLRYIIDCIDKLSKGKYKIEYDISLVRGQGYYTGAVFEIQSEKFSGAIAGGGRYDNLIGKFCGTPIPAVGFSIGFERIFSILLEQSNYQVVGNKKVALFYENDFIRCVQIGDKLRKDYDVSIFEKPKKLGKFLDKLVDIGYYGYCIAEENENIKVLKKE